mgnify:CR=1 FL=1
MLNIEMVVVGELEGRGREGSEGVEWEVWEKDNWLGRRLGRWWTWREKRSSGGRAWVWAFCGVRRSR